jgi:peptide/nickel transport system permease protein
VLFRHILPNGITPVVISASFSVAAAVVSESTLSFLGLGTIDQPSWGGMLSQSLGAGGQFQYWLAVFPGIAIFLTVLAYNLLGEALADALDPKRM